MCYQLRFMLIVKWIFGSPSAKMTELSACPENIMEGVVEGKDDQRVHQDGEACSHLFPTSFTKNTAL